MRKTKARITISSSIPFEIWEEAQNANWKWQDIIICGMIHKRGMPEMLERMKELEQNNTNLSQKLANYAKKYWELEEKLAQNEAKK